MTQKNHQTTIEKPLEDATAIVIDYGYFISLAQSLSRHFKKVYYYSPTDTEFKDANKSVLGDGLSNVERLDKWLDPDHLDHIDCFIFPDIDFGALQRHLRFLGKHVWGAMGASDIELSRTGFLSMVEKIGLPVVPYTQLTGLSALSDHLKNVNDKWVKINRYRANTETFYHKDYAHTLPKLQALNLRFGGFAERVRFVVQDTIETPGELGCDEWFISGQYPDKVFATYELKNELFIGSLLDYDDLPSPIREINAAIIPVLNDYGYQGFISTELRPDKNGAPNWIDPTLRAAGLALEQQWRNCTNLGNVIWQGSHGVMISPEYEFKFAAEATIHYTGDESEAQKIVDIPDSSINDGLILPSHFYVSDGHYWFPASDSDEIGVVNGFSNESIEDAIENLKENFSAIEDEPVYICVSDFNELLTRAKDNQANGIKFADEPLHEKAILAE